MIQRSPLMHLRTQEVQAAALRVISRKGFAGATMQEIADEAGLAKGTLYLYFKDRDDLFERAADFAFGKLEERLEVTLAGISEFSDKLRALIRTKIDFFDEHREFFRIYVTLKNPPAEVHQSSRRRRACHPRYASHLSKLEDLFRAAMDRGEVRRCDPGRLALVVAETSIALMLRRLTEDSPPDALSDSAWLTDVLLNGLAVPSKGTPT